jgi:hypothetical protein
MRSLGLFDEETCRLESIDNLFGPNVSFCRDRTERPASSVVTDSVALLHEYRVAV